MLIHEAIERTHREREALEAILKRYPDAEIVTLPDGRDVWSSVHVVPTDVLVSHGDKRIVKLCPYDDVSGVPVFTVPSTWIVVEVAILELQDKHRASFEKLLSLWAEEEG